MLVKQVLLTFALAVTIAAAPKDIPKQIEKDWVDARYAKVKFGPFVSGHIATPKGATHKGIAIRVGEQGEGTMVFDTDLCTWRAGWTGGFLKTDPARYGLIRALKPDGKILFANPPTPGVANAQGSFADPRKPKFGPLPKDWVRYRGLHLTKQGVVLEYKIGNTTVRELTYLESNSGMDVFIRYITMPKVGKDFEIQVWQALGAKWDKGGGSSSRFSLFESRSEVLKVGEKHQTLAVGGHDSTRELKSGKLIVGLKKSDNEQSLIITLFTHKEKKVSPQEFKMLRAIQTKHVNEIDPVLEVGWLPKPGPRRWGAPIITKGFVDTRKTAFAIDTITVPYKNRFNALFFTAGHDFTSNGDCYVATAHGDVWKVTGIDAELKAVK